jgi:hypothetical protein
MWLSVPPMLLSLSFQLLSFGGSGLRGASRPTTICATQARLSTQSSCKPAGNRSISFLTASYHSPFSAKLTIPCCIRPWIARARASLSVIGLSSCTEGYMRRSRIRFFSRASSAR